MSDGFFRYLTPFAQQASQQTGIDPRIIMAQAALESGFGRAAPGNNLFGIKSHGQSGGQTFTTHEVVNGKRVKIRDSFRKYGSPGESVQGYADFINNNKRYRPFKSAQGIDAQIEALGRSGYATDPNYASKIRSIVNRIPAVEGGPLPPIQTAQFDPVSAGAIALDGPENVFDPVSAGAIPLDDGPTVTPNNIPEADPDVIGQRVDTAHQQSNFPPQGTLPGDLAPFSADGQGGMQFDSDAGFVGAIKRNVLFPGKVLRGEEVAQDPITGEVNPQAIELGLGGLRGTGGLGLGARLVGPTQKVLQKQLATSNAAQQSAEAATRLQQAQRFGIDLSEGQVNRGQKTQALEEDILSGGAGEQAQKVLQQQRTQQAEQVTDAATRLQDELAPGNVQTTREAGDIIRDQVTDRAQELKRTSQEAFDNVAASDAAIDTKALPKLTDRVFQKLEEFGANEGTAIAPDMPNARRLFDRIKGITDNAPEGATGIKWGAIQNIRSQMVNFAKGGSPEAAAVREMRKGLDEWADEVVTQGLISGEKATLNELKKARKLWSDYKGIVNSPNRAVARIAQGDLDGSQIANLIVGASQVGNKGAGAGIVREIKRILPENSEVVGELKRGVMNKLFQDVATGDRKTYGKLASDLMKFTHNDAPELARELFGKDGLKAMREFAQVVRTLTPDSLATNPSRSGQTVARRFNDMLKKNAAILGFAVGDLSGAIGGLALTAVKDRGAVRRARRLTTPTPRPNRRQRNPGGEAPVLGPSAALTLEESQ